MKSIDFGAEIDGTEDFFQMFWPVTVSHKITEDSELYDMSSRDISCRWAIHCFVVLHNIHYDNLLLFCRKQFEIIVTLEGITPETGNTVQVNINILTQRKTNFHF